MLINNNHNDKYYFITPNIACSRILLSLVKKAISSGVSLIALRCNSLTALEYLTLAEKASDYAKKNNSRVLVKGNYSVLQYQWCQGIHLTAKQLLEYYNVSKKYPKQLIAASCHNIIEIAKAENLKIDFITLSPVLITSTHPQQKPLGISLAKYLTATTKLAVYWLGGQNLANLPQVLSYGAYGIAGITTFTQAFNK